MELKFLLKVDGNRGIPDSDWTRSALIDSDDSETIAAGAKTLVEAEFKRSAGKDMPDDLRKFTVTHPAPSYLDVQWPGDDHPDTLSYSVTPALSVGARAFILTEAEL